MEAPLNTIRSAPLDAEVFDDDAEIAAAGQLSEPLRLWNALVRAELGTVQSFPYYDQQAQIQQKWHQRLVIVAAISGSAAVILAILQLAALFSGWLHDLLANCEYVVAILALIAVGLGLAVAFHTRWQLLRMKAEQYRFVKFQFLLHAGGWLKQSEAQRKEHVQTLLAGIHALDSQDGHEWAQGVFSLVDDDPAVIHQADAPLAADLVRYFRAKRIRSQQTYFEQQAHRRHQNERSTWMIPPACFFLSIVSAFLHFTVEIAERLSKPEEQATSESATTMSAPKLVEASKAEGSDEETAAAHPPSALTIACLLGAALFPVLGAMIRTIRTAFEFGRNANRFAGVAKLLATVDRQLAGATAPDVQLELLREAEFVLQHENRSWMRLMIEAEWFG